MAASVEAVSAPGGKPTSVVRPRLAVEPESKRQPIIDDAEVELEGEMVVLEEGTRARNREVQRRIDGITARTARWEAKLAAEVSARGEAHDEVLEAFKSAMGAARAEWRGNVSATFDAFDQEAVPPLEERVDELQRALDEFVNVTVPRVIEEQSGTVTRKLKKSHETFDIDNTKILKREGKIVQRAEVHERRTRQRFEDERETRFRKLLLLGEEIDEVARVDDREEERQHTEMIQSLVELKARLVAESRTREVEDVEILESLGETMARLQASVIKNFGSKQDELSGSESEESGGEESGEDD